MPVHPFLEDLLANYPAMPERVEDYIAYRAANKAQTDELVQRVAEPGPEVREVHRVRIPVDGGEIDLKVYRPFGPGPHPLHLFLHGGAWMLGSIDHAHIDITCRERCIGAECVVVSVDYRKSPEHKFPAALHDCAAALDWAVERSADFGIDSARISLGGQSSGGNLSAALALKLRDEGGPPIALQLLEVPALDLTLGRPSHQEYGSGYVLDLRDLEIAHEGYLNSAAERTEPYASPLLAPDLSGLPPAHIMTAEYDPLRDDGAAYVERLIAAGVPAVLSMQAGHVHISSALTAVMDTAREWRTELLTVLRRAHATD